MRFDEADKRLLAKVCKTRREDVSGFVRRSVLSELVRLGYLADSDRKALGVASEQPGASANKLAGHETIMRSKEPREETRGRDRLQDSTPRRAEEEEEVAYA